MLSRKISIGIVIVLFFASVLGLEARSAAGDEFGTMWIASQESVVKIFDVVRAGDVHPPTHYVLLHYWGKLFGYSDVSMRAPSLLFALLSLFVLSKLIEILGETTSQGDRWTVFIVCATAPFSWATAVQARYYSLGMFLGLLSTYCYLSWRRKGGLATFVSTVLTAAILFYVHYLLAALVAFSQGAHYLSTIRKRSVQEVVIWVAAQLAIVTILTPVFLWNVHRIVGEGTRLAGSDGVEGVSGVKAIPFTMLGNMYAALTGAIPFPWDFWISAPILVVSAFVLVRGFNKGSLLINAEFMFLIVLPLTLLAILVPTCVPIIGYFNGISRAASLPMLLWIFMGLVIASVEKGALRRGLLITTLICNAYSLILLNFNLFSMIQPPPIKEIAGYIEVISSRSDSTIIFHPFIHGWGDPLNRYLPKVEARALTDHDGGISLDSSESIVRTRQPRSVWIVLSNRFGKKANELANFLERLDYRMVETREFQEQRSYDIWFKEQLKSLDFLDLRREQSHRFILTANRYVR
jgi:uncharacterized membrane protein